MNQNNETMTQNNGTMTQNNGTMLWYGGHYETTPFQFAEFRGEIPAGVLRLLYLNMTYKPEDYTDIDGMVDMWDRFVDNTDVSQAIGLDNDPDYDLDAEENFHEVRIWSVRTYRVFFFVVQHIETQAFFTASLNGAYYPALQTLECIIENLNYIRLHFMTTVNDNITMDWFRQGYGKAVLNSLVGRCGNQVADILLTLGEEALFDDLEYYQDLEEERLHINNQEDEDEDEDEE